MDEGVIKYRCDWQEADPVAAANIADLMDWRDRLHSWGLISVYENGIRFGNVSVRVGNSCQFVISGTQTAHLRTLGPESYCTVTEFNLEQNFLGCRGPVPAPSESLTHGDLYLHRDDVGAIIHVHNPQLWQQLLFKIPTTKKEIPTALLKWPEKCLDFLRRRIWQSAKLWRWPVTKTELSVLAAPWTKQGLYSRRRLIRLDLSALALERSIHRLGCCKDRG